MFDRRRLLRLKPMWVGIMGLPGKMPFRQRTKWSLIIYFGWLLAFPLQGPLLYSLAATAHYTNSNALGLLFIFFHALGLLSAGLYYFRKSFKKNILLASGLCSFFTSLAFLVVGPESWAFCWAYWVFLGNLCDWLGLSLYHLYSTEQNPVYGRGHDRRQPDLLRNKLLILFHHFPS